MDLASKRAGLYGNTPALDFSLRAGSCPEPEQFFCLADLPPVDLFIRTGGEKRISNFLLWQLAYSEFFFSNVLWPDFDQACLQQAVEDFSRRERRFGKTSAQLAVRN